MPRTYLPAALLASCLAFPLSATADDACGCHAEDLAAMRSADQALHNRIDHLDSGSPAQQKLLQHIQLAERVNTERLKVLVARCGWPSEAGDDAWLIVEHAGHDLAFQKRMLVLVEQAAAASGKRLGRPFAYLDDRIAVAEKRPQRYGTQMAARGGDRCALEFAPLDNPERVEERRAQVGLPTLDTYRRLALDLQKCPPPRPAINHRDEPWLMPDLAPQAGITRK